MQDRDFEKLGAFYLGKQYDLERGAVQDDLLLYDSKDLTTHAVCVGMTGSGKTGLCLSLLEEAAIDGIPAIAIDPKGDLGNLLLTFPDLAPADFLPWIDSAEATRKGMGVDEYAKRTAATWRKGLAEWGQQPERIAKFREAVDVSIYTPGSTAGLPLTVMKSFAAPSEAVMSDSDALRERILSAVSGLLALLGIDADPIRSREHILLSNVFDHAWRDGRNLDMAGLIREIQSPPFTQVGVMDLETIFPSKDRFGLAMQLNNLLASPGFSAWMTGDALDVSKLLYTDAGKPRLTILSIAHLSDAERMFFVTTVLNEMVSWMRGQPGTSSLRALLYMDEVFGYLPPTANPPSKLPLLTMLKQARAFGLGVMLATQNPVDLDYKALSNAGTWFLGRLQTERDKARVLDGLEGASANAGAVFDRARMEATLSGVGSRVFLMNNVHDDQPVVFHTRWALSYLRGPLTRSQIDGLMSERRNSRTATQESIPTEKQTPQRPIVPPGIDEKFLLPLHASLGSGQLVFRPALFGVARLHFVRASADLDLWQTVGLLSLVGDSVPANVWEEALIVDPEELAFESDIDVDARFASLATQLTRSKSYTAWKTALKNHLYRTQVVNTYSCKVLKEKSQPGESESDFRVRLKQRAFEERDLQVEKLRKKYAPKLKTLTDRIRRYEQRVEKEKSQLTQQSWKTALSFGTTVLGAMLGRKLGSSTSVSRAASSMRAAGRIASEKGDIDRAKETLEAAQAQFAEMEVEFDEDAERLRQKFDVDNLEIAEKPVRCRKSDLGVEQVTLVWTPWVVDSNGIAERAF